MRFVRRGVVLISLLRAQVIAEANDEGFHVCLMQPEPCITCVCGPLPPPFPLATFAPPPVAPPLTPLAPLHAGTLCTPCTPCSPLQGWPLQQRQLRPLFWGARAWPRVMRQIWTYMALGQINGTHLGVGAPPILVYFSGAWDVHWGYGLLTHVHMQIVSRKVQLPYFLNQPAKAR